MSFNQFLQILYARKRLILLTWLVIVALTLLVSFLLPSKYTAIVSVVVDTKTTNPISGLVVSNQLLPSFVATQTDIIKSHNVALKVVDLLKLADNPKTRESYMSATEGKGTVRDWLASALLRSVEVAPSRESSVLGISFEGADPQFAATLANAFAQAYMQTVLELKVQPSLQNAQFFDQQVDALRDRLEAAQRKLSAYQREKGVVISDERLDIETARLVDLSAQVVNAESLKFEAASRTGQGGAGFEVVNNQVVQNINIQLAQVEARLAELAKRTGPNHPDYIATQAQIDALNAQLRSAESAAQGGMTAASRSASTREADARTALAKQKSRVLELKQERDEMAVLQRSVENAQLIYDAALQRASTTRLESETRQTDIGILNPAVPPLKPSSPRTQLNFLIALIFGLIIGTGLAMLVEIMNRKVRTVEDIPGLLDIPVLAALGEKPRRGSLRRLTA